ncbi:MAG: hypothetical protein KBF45_14655 [Cyclobacteriaceae bacterium]|nr:hypothetical protein [Cyclobacteriaceae bacterium]
MKFSFLLILFIPIWATAQNNSNNFIYIELVPFASMMSNGNGAQFGFSHKTKNHFVHNFGLGFLFNNSPSGNEVDKFSFNDKPIREWSSEIDYTTHRPFTFENLVDGNDFENLDNYGIKHFKPQLSYRLNRYLNYDLQYDFRIKKLDLLIGVGLQGGLTVREDTYVGFTGKIISDVTGEEDEFWIQFNIRAKYLYWAPTSKLVVEYPVGKNLKLGLNCGLNYIFGRNFTNDTVILYGGLGVKVGIIN